MNIGFEATLIEIVEDHNECIQNHKKCIEQLQVENEYLRLQMRMHQRQLQMLRTENYNLHKGLSEKNKTIEDYLNDHLQRLLKLERRLFVNDHSLR